MNQILAQIERERESKPLLRVLAIFFIFFSFFISVGTAHAAYRNTIEAEGTLLNYWPMDEAAGATSLTAVVGGTAINLTGATTGVAGKIDGTAVSFNGTSNSAQTASSLNLTAYNKVVVEALLYIPSYTDTGRSVWEFSPNVTNSPSDTFMFNVDGGISGSEPTSNVALQGNGGYSIATYTRPTAGNWHHIVTVYNKGLSSNEVDLYIDGELHSPTRIPIFNTNSTNNFGDRVLYLMARNASTLFTEGKMQHLAIYSDLSDSRILAHAQLMTVASAVTLTGPASGNAGQASTNFTAGANGTISNSIVVTPNDNSAGGIFTPTSVTLSSGTTTATFTYTPSSSGTKTISVTNNVAITNPSGLSYSAISTNPATSVLFTGPTTASKNVASSNFTVSANGIISGNLIVTPSDSGAGGTFTPTSVTISAGSPTATFTYTPVSTGSKTISVTNNGGLTNLSNISIFVVLLSSGSGIILGDSTVATYAGGSYISSFLYTPAQISAGWTQNSIAVPGHTIAQQKAVYLSTADRATYDFSISQIGLNDMDPAEASSVAIARFQDLIDTINANKKAGALTIISTMIPVRQRYIDVYGATNGPIAWQKFLDINEAIKGNGPTYITGVDYRISDHFALLDDGLGNLNAIYDTGDHVHQNNAARQINAQVWRDSLAELGLLEATTTSAPIIGTATVGSSSAIVTFTKPQFSGGSTITSYTVISSPGNITATGITSPISISGLTSGLSYSFTVAATNLAGVSSSSTSSNTILITDTSAPTISNVLSTPNSTGSSITWNTTGEDSSSIVDYGLTSSYGTSTTEADTVTRVQNHTVVLSGLPSCTSYNFRVRSKDEATNEGVGTNNTFTTTGCTGSSTVTAQTGGSIITASGGTVSLLSSGYGLGLTIPAGATVANAEYQIKKVDSTTSIASSGKPSGFNLIGDYTYELKSLTDPNTSVTSFSQPIQITVSYQDSDVVGINESSLVIYHYSGSVWSPLTGCVVNTTLNTVTCTTTGFSFFALFGTTTTTSSSHSSGSGIRYGCKDTNASNYEYFASHKQSLCEYGQNTTNTNTSAHNFTRNLKLGDVNEEVRSLQKLLNSLGFTVSTTGAGSAGNETNMFGPATQAALIRYQVSKGITPAIGYFGPLTKASLGNTPAVPKNPVISSEQTQNLDSLVFAAPLYKDLQSADVRRLQTFLATKPEIYPEGLISGYFGPLTEKAVQTFQLNYGVVGSKLDSGFGLVGPKTRAKLQEVFGN